MIEKKTTAWLDLTNNWADVAWVHGKQGLDTVFELTQWDPRFHSIYEKIADLSHSYYIWWSSFPSWVAWDAQFETKLKDIFKNDTTWFKEYLEDNKVSIDKSASDILKSLKMKRAQNQLKMEVWAIVRKTLDDLRPLSAPDPKIKTIENNFILDMSTKLKEFIQK